MSLYFSLGWVGGGQLCRPPSRARVVSRREKVSADSRTRGASVVLCLRHPPHPAAAVISDNPQAGVAQSRRRVTHAEQTHLHLRSRNMKRVALVLFSTWEKKNMTDDQNVPK